MDPQERNTGEPAPASHGCHGAAAFTGANRVSIARATLHGGNRSPEQNARAPQNWQLARLSYEKAAELIPQDDATPYNVALCMARLGYFQDAAA